MGASDDVYLDLLEEIRWKGIPECPYCASINSTSIKKEQRYHCNSCFNSYSVTVDTLFHGSKVPLSKWFETIQLYLKPDLTLKTLSARSLAKIIDVNKNTAASILKRIRLSVESEPELLKSILSKKPKGKHD